MARAVNKHHLWWPKRHYQTQLERTFRELPCHIVELAVVTHDLLHHCSEPPTKPQSFEMVEAIRAHEARKCPCYPQRGRDPINPTTGRKRYA